MDFSSLTKRLDAINKPAIHSLIVNFSGIDENFHENVKNAIEAGFDVGVYVYSQVINEECDADIWIRPREVPVSSGL